MVNNMQSHPSTLSIYIIMRRRLSWIKERPSNQLVAQRLEDLDHELDDDHVPFTESNVINNACSLLR